MEEILITIWIVSAVITVVALEIDRRKWMLPRHWTDIIWALFFIILGPAGAQACVFGTMKTIDLRRGKQWPRMK